MPIDHPHVSHSAGKTFTVPLVRLRGSNYAARNVLLRPGRPGGSGAEFLQCRDDFHLVGFELRDAGASEPQARACRR